MIKHLALIMDGNRRWAKARSLRPWLGHDAGSRAINEVIQFCIEQNIPYLSLYAFSLENFKRSSEEVAFLFDLFLKQLAENQEKLISQGIRVTFVGDRSLFPTSLQNAIDSIEEKTKNNSQLTILFLFCYGAQQEMSAAMKTIASKVQSGTLSLDAISPELIANHLWTAGIPDPDLIIRTGGRKRLSNFLLFQAAYSELHFLDCLWPDIRTQHLEQAVTDFKQTQRNFGN